MNNENNQLLSELANKNKKIIELNNNISSNKSLEQNIIINDLDISENNNLKNELHVIKAYTLDLENK